MSRRVLGGLLALCFLLLAPQVAAQDAANAADKATARDLAIEGNKALEAKQYKKAADLYRRAEALYHAPTLLIGLAKAYTGLGKYVEASEAYQRVIREKLTDASPKAFFNAQEQAKQRIEGVKSKIGFVIIDVQGPKSPRVTIDGVAVSVASLGVKRPVNPGTHAVVAEADGFEKKRAEFTASAKKTRSLTIRLEPSPTASVSAEGGSNPALRIGGYASLGLGAAGLVVGGVTGGMALGRHDELSAACTAGVCPADQSDNLDSFRTLGGVSTVGFIAGGVFAAVGTTLVVIGLMDDEPESASVDARGLTVRF